jgi:hypothetical protein
MRCSGRRDLEQIRSRYSSSSNTAAGWKLTDSRQLTINLRLSPVLKLARGIGQGKG